MTVSNQSLSTSTVSRVSRGQGQHPRSPTSSHNVTEWKERQRYDYQ
jgi:hypothetical protein